MLLLRHKCEAGVFDLLIFSIVSFELIQQLSLDLRLMLTTIIYLINSLPSAQPGMIQLIFQRTVHASSFLTLIFFFPDFISSYVFFSISFSYFSLTICK